jgi:hypothetical protein
MLAQAMIWLGGRGIQVLMGSSIFGKCAQPGISAVVWASTMWHSHLKQLIGSYLRVSTPLNPECNRNVSTSAGFVGYRHISQNNSVKNSLFLLKKKMGRSCNYSPKVQIVFVVFGMCLCSSNFERDIVDTLCHASRRSDTTRPNKAGFLL